MAVKSSLEKKERKKPVRRTAVEKAQQALDVVERKLARAQTRADEYKVRYEAAQAEAEILKSERDYLAAHPALQEPVSEADLEAMRTSLRG